MSIPEFLYSRLGKNSCVIRSIFLSYCKDAACWEIRYLSAAIPGEGCLCSRITSRQSRFSWKLAHILLILLIQIKIQQEYIRGWGKIYHNSVTQLHSSSISYTIVIIVGWIWWLIEFSSVLFSSIRTAFVVGWIYSRVVLMLRRMLPTRIRFLPVPSFNFDDMTFGFWRLSAFLRLQVVSIFVVESVGDVGDTFFAINGG